ncbi:MAG: Abi family protein [Bifidobacteriaceae bacterium]|jgi:abortive infection bacteriophage resistance protein|nr:Abi family protein [Bifidobacteriaceae bacterium]
MSKEPKTIPEMVEMLRERGLKNKTDVDVAKYLYEINYYRFSGYARYYQVDPLSGNNTFYKNADIATIIKLIKLDKELRRIIFEGIQIFEIAFRASLAYQFVHTFGDYGYLNLDTYLPSGSKAKHKISSSYRLLNRIYSQIERSDEPCMLHFKNKNERVPVYAAVEILTFDTIVTMYEYCNNFNCKKDITDSFDINDSDNQSTEARKIFGSNDRFIATLKVFSILRNLCAHHSRIWNRLMKTSPSLSRGVIEKYFPHDNNGESNFPSENSVIRIICLLAMVVDEIEGNSLYSEHIFALIDSNKAFKNGLYSPTRGKVGWNGSRTSREKNKKRNNRNN